MRWVTGPSQAAVSSRSYRCSSIYPRECRREPFERRGRCFPTGDCCLGSSRRNFRVVYILFSHRKPHTVRDMRTIFNILHKGLEINKFLAMYRNGASSVHNTKVLVLISCIYRQKKKGEKQRTPFFPTQRGHIYYIHSIFIFTTLAKLLYATQASQLLILYLSRASSHLL